MVTKTKNTVSVTKADYAAANAERVMKKVDELYVVREKYETETLARSNKELYAILGDIYGVFKAACEDNCLAETVVRMKAALDKRNVKTQSNSPALTIFVRYIFNSDRKRAYNYTRTLMAFIKDRKGNETISDFIERNNGVEECKKSISKKPETLAKEEAIKSATVEVMETLESMPSTETVKLPNSSVNLSDSCSYAFVIARVANNGKLDLLRAVPMTTKAMEASAIKELAKDLLVTREIAKANSKLKRKEKTTALAAATMTVKQVEELAIA